MAYEAVSPVICRAASISDLPILLIIVRVRRSFRFLVTRHRPAAALAGIKEKGLRVDRRVMTGRLDELRSFGLRS